MYMNTGKSRTVELFAIFLLWLGLAWARPAVADPGYYLVTPYAVPGQWALDLRYWTVKSPGKEAVLWPELGIRYGVNSRWTSELLVSLIGKSLRDQKISTLNWQNSWLLTQGQFPFDLAVHAQLIHDSEDGNQLELGPVLQTEVGLTQLNFNLIFEHSLSPNQGTELKYQWQALRRLTPGLRAGLQGFGELDRWDRWSGPQSHRIGPVIRVGLMKGMELQAAYLWGEVYDKRGRMFSAQLVLPF